MSVVSNAGASSESTDGFAAFGTALDIGSISNDSHAFVGTGSYVVTPNDLHVNAKSNEQVLSVSAALADGGSGTQNRLYINNGTAAPFAGVAGQDAGGRDTLTSSVAIGDLNGDGKPDMVTGDFAQFNRVYLNDGSGNFDAGKEMGSALGALGQPGSPHDR